VTPSDAFEISRRSWELVDGRDLEGFLEIVHEVWWEQVGESLGTLSYEPTEMRDLGGDAVLTRLVVSGTFAGVEVPQTMWHVVQVRDLKAEWWGSYRTEEEALQSLEAFRARAGAD
jgi:hypothetical protein